MGKLWWFGGATVVAGGMFWAVHQAGFALGGRLAGWCPMARGGRTAANSCRELLPSAGPLEEIPAEPTPVEEPQDVAAAAADAQAPVPAIVINEDGPPSLEPVELAIYKGLPGPADVAGCPLTMPYCDDEAPKMPYAADTDETESSRSRSVQNGQCPYSGCYGADHCNLAPAPAGKPAPASPEAGQEESEEPPMPASKEEFHIQIHESAKPRGARETMPHATLDTMEYRRSDGTVGEFVPGPV